MIALSNSGRSLTKISISSPKRGFGPGGATDVDDAPAVDEARGLRVAVVGAGAAGVTLPVLTGAACVLLLTLLTGVVAAGVRLLVEELPPTPVFLELMTEGEQLSKQRKSQNKKGKCSTTSYRGLSLGRMMRTRAGNKGYSGNACNSQC